MPYRTELDTLRARRDVLRATLRKPLTEDELRATERELDDVAARIRALDPGARSLLDRITIATPCSASWDAMTGDDRARHCAACSKKVYDLSALTRAEAEALLARSGEAPCVRLYRRRDGTIVTADCTRDLRRSFQHVVVATALAAGAVLLASVVSASGERRWLPLEPLSSARERTAAAEPRPSSRPQRHGSAWPRWDRADAVITMGFGFIPIERPAEELTPEQRQDAWLFRR